MGFIHHKHPVHGESHIQRNVSNEVATTSFPFNNEPHRSHILFVKVASDMTFTSWSQQHFVEIGKLEQQMRKALHCGSKQQQRSPDKITLLMLVRATYTSITGVNLRAHPVRGESHIQCNANQEVATIHLD